MINIEVVVVVYQQVTPEPQFSHLQNGNRLLPEPEISHGPSWKPMSPREEGAQVEHVMRQLAPPADTCGAQAAGRCPGGPRGSALTGSGPPAPAGAFREGGGGGAGRTRTAALGFLVSCHSVNPTGNVSGL